MSKIIDSLVPSELHQTNEWAWGKYLVVLGFAGLPLGLAFSLWYVVALDSVVGGVVLGAMGVCSALVPLVLRLTRSVAITVNALVAVIFVGITGAAIVRGGFPFSVLVWSIGIPVALLPQQGFRKFAPFWVVICVLQLAAFFLLSVGGYTRPALSLGNVGTVTEHLLVLVGFLALMLVISYTTARISESYANQRDEYLDALVRAQRVEALGTLAGGIAHDFNNVLTAVQFSTDVISVELPEDHRGQREIANLRSAIDQSRTLTRQLLNLGRAGGNKPEPLSINAEIHRVEAILRRVMGRSIELDTELAEDLSAVRIDPTRLEQVLINLAVNASHAMTEGGRLTIRSFPLRDCVVVEVADTGCGIPEDVAEHIFDAFYTTKPPGRGSGLGLWISRTIVRDAGGEMTIDSKVGEGTTVRITLPVFEQRKQLAVGSRSDLRTIGPSSRGILLVDDDDGTLRQIEHALTRAGYDVICADSSERALSIAVGADVGIELLITDLTLPDMAGTELVDRIRVLNPDIKVLYTTGNGATAIQAPALPKPLDVEDLLDHIEQQLAASPHS